MSFTGISMHKGYAFVQFTNPFDARNACHGEDGKTVLNQVLGEFLWHSDVAHVWNWPNFVAENFLSGLWLLWELLFLYEFDFLHSNCVSRSTYQPREFSCSKYYCGKSQWSSREMNVKTWKFEKLFRTFHMNFPLVDDNQVNKRTRVELSADIFSVNFSFSDSSFVFVSCEQCDLISGTWFDSRILIIFWFRVFTSFLGEAPTHILRWKIYSRPHQENLQRKFWSCFDF